jgi:hypothetical protein
VRECAATSFDAAWDAGRSRAGAIADQRLSARKGAGAVPLNAGKAATPAKLPATGTIARRRAYHGAAAVPAWRASGGQMVGANSQAIGLRKQDVLDAAAIEMMHFGCRVFRRKPWRASGLAGELGIAGELGHGCGRPTPVSRTRGRNRSYEFQSRRRQPRHLGRALRRRAGRAGRGRGDEAHCGRAGAAVVETAGQLAGRPTPRALCVRQSGMT